MASRSVEMQAAQQTVVLPAMLKPKEERQVQELVSMGFDRGQVLHLSKLNLSKLNRQVQELVSMGFDRGQVLHLSKLNPFSLN
jgi:Fe2+ transport system protein FeoA